MSPGERLGWTLAGLATGVLAGLALGQMLGRVSTRRLASEVGRWGRRGAEPAPRMGRLAGAVQEALQADELLGVASLEAIAAGPGIIELHGWVASRALRARAGRIAAAVPGIESLINAILVHGEDDLAPGPDLAISDQTA
jgi:hypothetical protein